MELRRKIKITIEENDDLSVYTLKCYIDGKETLRQEEYSLSDSLISLYDFHKRCFDEFEVDTRYDDYEVSINTCC